MRGACLLGLPITLIEGMRISKFCSMCDIASFRTPHGMRHGPTVQGCANCILSFLI